VARGTHGRSRVVLAACRPRRYRSRVPSDPETQGHGPARAPRAQRFSPLEYRDPSPAPWLIHLLGVLNRYCVLGGLMKLRSFDLPAADLARLEAAVNPGTAAFLGPNHPEFLTDWMVDKELSRRVSPLMAHWASYEIVNASPAARAFWLANNLIANVPGGGGRAYSVSWALRGHGVLLHPEGTATWQGERVSRLLPGIVDMAWDAATTLRERGEARGVWLVPVAWRLAFAGDASRGLAREVAWIERGLHLPPGEGPLGGRFAALMCRLLARQCERLGLAVPRLDAVHAGRDYFAAQAAALAELRASLAARYGELDADVARAQFQLRRAMRERATADPEGVRRDRARLMELQRLAGFDPALYDRPRLAQERIAEVLKRTRSSLLTRGFGNALQNTVPVAVAARVAHVRVAEPLAVHAAVAATRPGDEPAARSLLLAAHRDRLQAVLDQLGLALSPAAERHAVGNALWSGSPAP
jgi:hypothetical protein